MVSYFFSIIIPTYNEEENLPFLLNALEKQTKKDFEIIVVDSLSKDKTLTVIKEFQKRIPNLRYFQKKMKNVSQARNFGAKNALGRYIIFFDADVIPEENFIRQIEEKITKNNLDLTTVWNRSKRKKLTGRLILLLLNISMTLFQKIKPAANGPCIIIKKSVFNQIGGFDEEIVFGEDFDLVQRASKLKAKFQVFRYPLLYVSTRRFEKEGLILSLYKSIKAVFYQLFFGPIKKPIFEYQMGGEYYKKRAVLCHKVW